MIITFRHIGGILLLLYGLTLLQPGSSANSSIDGCRSVSEPTSLNLSIDKADYLSLDESEHSSESQEESSAMLSNCNTINLYFHQEDCSQPPQLSYLTILDGVVPLLSSQLFDSRISDPPQRA